MKNLQSAIIRHSIVLCALGCLTACVTSADQMDNSSDDDTVDTAQPPVFQKRRQLVGHTETGEKIYCRRMSVAGSRVRERVCMTEEQRREQQAFVEEVRKGVGRRSLKSRAAH